jgi:hypothetical protein
MQLVYRYSLGEGDHRVKHWRKTWRNAFERAWHEAYTTPAAHFAHNGKQQQQPDESRELHIPESRRRILQVLTQSTNYSGYNFPGSIGRGCTS